MSIDLLNPPYPIDYVGNLPSNKIIGEQQILTPSNYRDYHTVVPKQAPFFSESLIVTFKGSDGVSRQLHEGIDYQCTHWFISASRACAKPIYGSITILDLTLSGVITLQSYQTLGGIWTQDASKIAQILADTLHNPRSTSWDVVVDMPVTFPPVDHQWDLQDLVGASAIVTALNDIANAIANTQVTGFAGHLIATNPHKITPQLIGTLTTAQITQLVNQTVSAAMASRVT
jgi:hypothetical protein